MSDNNLKQQLYTACLEVVNKRAEAAKYAMEEAQASANTEEKSSAGDKYETGRAMSQLARDMNAKQLKEAMKEIAYLEQLKPDIVHTQVLPGACARATSGNYFIAVSAGMLKIGAENWIALSPAAPLAALMLHKKTGDTFNFRDKKETILEVF